MSRDPSPDEQPTHELCVGCGLPVGEEAAAVRIANGRLAHSSCVEAPSNEVSGRGGAVTVRADTVRAAAEIARGGQGGGWA
jgi:hypothetical protein